MPSTQLPATTAFSVPTPASAPSTTPIPPTSSPNTAPAPLTIAIPPTPSPAPTRSTQHTLAVPSPTPTPTPQSTPPLQPPPPNAYVPALVSILAAVAPPTITAPASTATAQTFVTALDR